MSVRPTWPYPHRTVAEVETARHAHARATFDRLDRLSRTRALTEAESNSLEIALRIVG